MTDAASVSGDQGDREPVRPALIYEQLAAQVLGKAQAEGAELLGPDGLLSQVTRAVRERALGEEMTAHRAMRNTTWPAAGREKPQRHDAQDVADRCRRGGPGAARDVAGSIDRKIVRKG
jgi:putative transposase